MPRLKGYFIDYLTPSTDPKYKYEVQRLHFSVSEKKAYTDFIQGHESIILTHGKRYS